MTLKNVNNIYYNHLYSYPTPSTLNYFSSFGSMAGLVFSIQFCTGLLLSIFYVNDIQYAFSSVEYIIRNVEIGWFLRYIHSNGASFFFFVVYAHIIKNIFYKVYTVSRFAVWNTGILIYLVLIGTAFLGYVLPWSQIGFWGATVITNIFTVLPYIGENILNWVWGAFSVSNATLHRFFVVHFILPFFLILLIFIHIIFLHINGSTNPLGNDEGLDVIPFYPYFYIKDFIGFMFLLLSYFFLVSFYPNLLGHALGYVPADSIKTPPHVVPEWYFLPFYAVLKTIPHKTLGIIAIFSVILSIVFLPIFDKSLFKSIQINQNFRMIFWFLIFDLILLGKLGKIIVEYPFDILSQYSTFFLFIILLVLITRFTNRSFFK